VCILSTCVYWCIYTVPRRKFNVNTYQRRYTYLIHY
jgi:hypothetical protein